MPHSRDVVAADEVPMLQSVALMYYVPGAVPRGEVSVVACARRRAGSCSRASTRRRQSPQILRDVTIPGDLHVAHGRARARAIRFRARRRAGALASGMDGRTRRGVSTPRGRAGCLLRCMYVERQHASSIIRHSIALLSCFLGRC